MNNKLSKYIDSDGLISLKDIVISNEGLISIDDISLKSIYENSKICDYIFKNKDIFAKTSVKLLLEPKKEGKYSISAAPIIGISFQEGLKRIISGNLTLKSMFYFEDDVSEYGIEGRLIASYEKRNNEIIFQLWEITKFDIPIFYLHGVFNIDKNRFIHFDGALILMDSETKEKMKQPYLPMSEKEKKFPYQKLFRLDGEIDIPVAMALADEFLPIEELSKEFLIKEENVL